MSTAATPFTLHAQVHVVVWHLVKAPVSSFMGDPSAQDCSSYALGCGEQMGIVRGRFPDKAQDCKMC